ncbi:MAG: thiamine-phosphate kinase [Omnitrophica bacterium RIFCSPHIGHO2_02_FULL_51_18]|nr:MAG: thiamine-phosphate kinase [Omnitrophica bacterium RIFCSPHIGHO2_02_FULL_51_18]
MSPVLSKNKSSGLRKGGVSAGRLRTLRQAGEFGFIERVRKMLPKGAGVELGIGDDAAVLKIGNKTVLFTTDMIIEDKHFRLGQASGFEIGWKALGVNLSDIAAMGGVPTHAVVALGAPGDLPLRFAHDIYRGIRAAARRFRVNIIGGDTNASKKLILSIALLGEANQGKVTRRSGAKLGDIIFVSGTLGGSYASKKHLRFTPRIKESQFLLRHFDVHAMMDISDGLASDIFRLTEASRVGACLSTAAIPCTPGVHFGQALTEGEDFELLFTLSPKEASKLALVSGKKRGLASFCPVGKIMPKSYGVRLVDANGKGGPLEDKGFDHFK